MKRLSTTLVLICIIVTSYGQTDFRNGYIITNAKDTLFGLVDYQQGTASYRSCKFKKSKNENIITYHPGEIPGYGFVNDKYFESREIGHPAKNLEFLEVIVKGAASLYRFEGTYLVEKDNQGLQVLRNESREAYINGRTVMRETNEHVGILNMLFFDCVKLRDDLEKIQIRERLLTALVEAYNECQGQPGITFKANKPWIRAAITLAGGINSSDVKNNGFLSSGGDYVASYRAIRLPFAGVLFDVSSPRLYEPLAFHAGVFYQNSKFYGYGISDPGGTITRNYITLQAHSVKFPIGVRYTFPERKITPFINAGMSYTHNITSHGSALQERQANGVVETYYYSDVAMDVSQLGYWAGIGGVIKLPYRFDGLVELRYESCNGTALVSLRSQITTFQLMLGIRTK